MKITEKHWKELDEIGIDRNLVSEQDCGIWFKNVGCVLLVDDDKKMKLLSLNTKLQSGENV